MAGLNIKVQSETFGGADKSWIRTRKGLEDMLPIMVDISRFVAAHVVNGRIPSGTAVGEVTASPGVYGPYDDSLADGTNVLAGHLFEDVLVDTGDVATATDVAGTLYWHGVVKESKLPLFTGTTKGELDANGKADVSKLIRYV